MGDWPGYFISLEGLDGAGKSTQATALALALRHAGHEVLSVRDPHDTELGGVVRGFVLQHQHNPLDPWVEALLFTAGRVQLLRDVILPALDQGRVVVCDRFADSTIAYQGGGRGLPQDALLRLHAQACGDVWPDLTLYLALPHAVAANRRHSEQLPVDRMEAESESFHAAVAATFDELGRTETPRIVPVDAERPAVAVSTEICDIALARLGAQRPTVPVT
ncbi:MAG: dTMP kinase [Candidatus Dormibacteria bacterium]